VGSLPTAVKRHNSLTIFDTVLYVVMILFGILTLYPFVNIIALSFNDAIDSVKGDIYLFPRMFTIENYRQIFRNDQLTTALWISTIRTIIGTATGVVFSAMVAYTVSRKKFMARKFFSLMLALTMYVSGGLIPDYLLIRNIHLMGSFLVYIIPPLIGAWNIFIIRSYIDGLPESLFESAYIDGANDIVVFFKIVLPLCMPVLATVSLFIAVFHWNSWFDTYLYCNGKKGLTTLQYELQKMLSYANTQISAGDSLTRVGNPNMVKVTPESLKMAMTMVATAPILLVYPFIQKYFVTGMTLGAVKG
jgi:putative aldouronate transport system permease protein